jgi:putative ABC transport system ATP-binding protein
MMSLLRVKKKLKVEPLEVDSDIVVKVDNISKSFVQDDREIIALSNVSFDVKKGEFVAIVGRSGSGKTTLLNMLGTMEKPSSGRISIVGKTLANLSRRELTLIRRDDISTIYQDYNLIPVLSAYQNVELPLILTKMSKDERNSRVNKLLKMVGLVERSDHKPDQLSGGERQRVTIARAIANRPKIILADEPTGDLDVEIGQGIIELLEGVNRDLETTLIMVTHDLELAKRADRIIKIQEGKIIDISKGEGEKIRQEEEKNRVRRSSDDY